MTEGSESNFKSVFRYYKQKVHNDFAEVIDMNGQSNDASLDGRVSRVQIDSKDSELFGVKSSRHWMVYQVRDHPGLLIVKNPLTDEGQRYWIARCLRDFPRKPNRRNIDIDERLANKDNYWEYCINTDFKLIDKLRWATLGYHHNWDTKIYTESRRGDFPSDLAAMSEHLASELDYPAFKAQAAIVNMYHPDSSLSAHVDHSEVDLEAPLLSFSFGQPAIFLIGGKSLGEPVSALLLESGDVMVMGRSARLSYHAVPRILKSDSRPWKRCLSPPDAISIDGVFCKDVISLINDDSAWQPFDKYASRSRINLNVRQVLPAGYHSLADTYAKAEAL